MFDHAEEFALLLAKFVLAPSPTLRPVACTPSPSPTVRLALAASRDSRALELNCLRLIRRGPARGPPAQTLRFNLALYVDIKSLLVTSQYFASHRDALEAQRLRALAAATSAADRIMM